MARARERILIANRGEVALRIAHAARELGYGVVMVASSQDQTSMACQQADEVVLLEGATLKDTYLDGAKVIAAAKKTNAKLIHPGFGFLSESPDFATAVQKAGLLWIGPTGKSMERVSSKTKAKQTAEKLKIPIVPYLLVREQPTKAELQKIIDEIEFPCLIKAVMGGGGKGHKVVEKPSDLLPALQSSQREALNAFGDAAIFVERLLQAPRHIEIQVFGEGQGKSHAFGERDCSVQRRFQKIIEESPAVGLSEKERSQLENYAKALVDEIDYRNAGTVEFLWDEKRGAFYFMEMNTRLQVEHGVTEERYGIDLVKMQILTARGDSIKDYLPTSPPAGHVIELRLYAEDAEMGFLPQPGRVHHLQFPTVKGFRLESGIQSGDTITGDYDPMVAKLLVRGANRPEAVEKAIYVLRATEIVGPTTNRDFLLAVLQHPKFQSDGVSTAFLQQHFASWRAPAAGRNLALAIAKALSGVAGQGQAMTGEAKAYPPAFSAIAYGRQFL